MVNITTAKSYETIADTVVTLVTSRPTWLQSKCEHNSLWLRLQTICNAQNVNWAMTEFTY